MHPHHAWICRISLALALSFVASALCPADDAPPNPLKNEQSERTDAVFGAMTLSDGSVVRGKVYLTRGHQLRIYDTAKEENRDVPLKAIREIRCHVEKEWMEAEWRFKENANDEKVLTGRKYPARIYVYEVILVKGSSINGTLPSVIYIEPESTNNRQEKESVESKPVDKSDAEALPAIKPVRYLLHHRDKGDPGKSLRDMVYIEKIVFGEAAKKLSSPVTTGKRSDSAPRKK